MPAIQIYQFQSQEFVNFQRLKSPRLDIRLPPRGYALALPHPRSGGIVEVPKLLSWGGVFRLLA